MVAAAGGAVAELATPLVLGTVRRLLRARTEEEVVGALIDVVRDLGGVIVPPSESGADQLPVDVTFGLGGPLVPSGRPEVLATLSEVLPPLVDDAHVALERARVQVHLAESAATDVLTGLANRRSTMRVLARLGRGDTVAMVDLDHFKRVNDTYGHDAGDAVLRSFARAVRGVVRTADTAGRIGGEEFVLLLPHTSPAGAVELLARLRVAWAAVRPYEVTFSGGVAAVGPSGPRAALARADSALYAAKGNGRDRVEVADG
ncbi:MAG: GGDEF domain-containing protein [Actinomycetota bacterium]